MNGFGSERAVLYERAGVDGLCPSAVCWRARIALALKDVEALRRPVRFADVDRLAEATGSRTVPVLALDGAVIINSDTIAAHLDAVVPGGPRLMGDEAAAAGAELDREFDARVGPLVAADLQRRLAPEDREHFQASREARYGRTFEDLEDLRAGLELDLAFSIGRLEPRLEAHRYLAGDEVGWLDIAAYTHLLLIAFASPRSMPQLVNPVRTWFDRRDAEWREICLKPSVPGGAGAEPAP